jgi:hypothetical protein
MKANLLRRPLGLALFEQRGESKMNSYLNLMLEVDGTKERLRRPLQSALALKAKGNSVLRIRSMTQLGAARLESIIWTISCLIVILGLFKAAHSEQPLLWLAAWPIPVTLACTIFIFVREGFHFRNGVLVFGRRRN